MKTQSRSHIHIAALLCGLGLVVPSHTRAAPAQPAPAKPGTGRPVSAKAPATPVSAMKPALAPPPLPTGAGAGAYQPTAAERNSRPAPAALSLARGGQALVPVLIAGKAGPETRRSAQELGEILGKITGATFAIQTPDGKAVSLAPSTEKLSFAERAARDKALAEERAAAPAEPLPVAGIVVGTATEWQMPAELAEGLAMRGPFHGREAFAIRTDARRLLLLGNTGQAVTHAVYRLLHEMGCRWFATGANWEIIPHTPGLAFDQNITDRPSIAARVIAFMDGVEDERERLAQRNWTRRNALGSSIGTDAAHNWHAIVEANEAEFLVHPEYFAEVNGLRRMPTYVGKDGKTHVRSVWAKLELGNPAVRKMFVDYALAYFRRNPGADMLSLSPTDGGGFSESAESKALGDVSDAVFGLVNEVARAVAREFPGKMIGCYAYREAAAPPSFMLEPNVYVEVATLFNMTKYNTEQLLQLWPKKAKNLGLYRYFSYYDAGGSEMPGGPIAGINWTTDTIRTDYSRGTVALFAQSSNAFAMQMRGYLVATRLMWNPDSDVNAILADFYDKAYGPASAPMQRFHERTGKDSHNEVNFHLLGAAFRDLDEATRLAKDRPDVLARLSDLKQYMRWTHLRLIVGATLYGTPEQKEKYRENYIAMMRAAAAMAPTYMAQWNMIRIANGRTVTPQNKDYKPLNAWTGFTPPTPESIEADFQDSLKQLPTVEIPKQDFDLTDLVPVVFPPAPGLDFTAPLGMVPPGDDPLQRREYYQLQSPQYIFYSFNGEPLEVSLLAGVRGAGPPGIWSLSKPDGKGGWTQIEQGEVPSDKTLKTVSIAVPAKGPYAFRFNGQNSAGYVHYSIDKPISVIAAGAVDFASPYIYVPKGTKEIWVSFYQANGGGQNLLLPDGKQAAHLVHGVYNIPVPEGMDGRLWRFARGSKFRFQQFFNIPNVAAASPAALLVPREVAIKDGLVIRNR